MSKRSASHIKYVLKEKDFERLNASEKVSDGNDCSIREILRSNANNDSSLQYLSEPPQKKRASYRLRDWILIMVLGNGLLGGFIAFAPKSPYYYVPAAAGIVILSVGATWVLWFVMDKY